MGYSFHLISFNGNISIIMFFCWDQTEFLKGSFNSTENCDTEDKVSEYAIKNCNNITKIK